MLPSSEVPPHGGSVRNTLKVHHTVWHMCVTCHAQCAQLTPLFDPRLGACCCVVPRLGPILVCCVHVSLVLLYFLHVLHERMQMVTSNCETARQSAQQFTGTREQRRTEKVESLCAWMTPVACLPMTLRVLRSGLPAGTRSTLQRLPRHGECTSRWARQQAAAVQ